MSIRINNKEFNVSGDDFETFYCAKRMERQLLKIYVILIGLVGCQQVEIIQDYENNKLVQSVEINNDLQFEKTIITYENI